jgi:hypothetical protein
LESEALAELMPAENAPPVPKSTIDVSLGAIRRKAAILGIHDVAFAVRVGDKVLDSAEAADAWLEEQLWGRYDAIRKELFGATVS